MGLHPVAATLACLLLAISAPAGAQERLTLFVTSEKTGVVSVYRGAVPDLVLVASIPAGREPHNLGISPDGRWVATSDRRSGEVLLIDTGRAVRRHGQAHL